MGLRSPSESPQHIAQPERKSERGCQGVPRSLAYTIPSCLKTEPKDSSPGPHGHSFLDLKHFTSGISGFLADEFAIGAFLSLLQEQLDKLSSHNPPEKPKLLEGQSCSGSRDGSQSRLHRFSKVLSEAQWRYKVVTSNQGSGERRQSWWVPKVRKGKKSQECGRERGVMWESHLNSGHYHHSNRCQKPVSEPVQIFPYLLSQQVGQIKIEHSHMTHSLLFQRSSLPEDTGPLPQGIQVSAGGVGREGAGQVI